MPYLCGCGPQPVLGPQHNPTASGRYNVSVHMSLTLTKGSHCGQWLPSPHGTAQLGPRIRGRKCWSDRQLDGGGSHPGLGVCRLGDEQLPVQRGCGKGFGFQDFSVNSTGLPCTVWNVGVFLLVSGQLFCFLFACLLVWVFFFPFGFFRQGFFVALAILELAL